MVKQGSPLWMTFLQGMVEYLILVPLILLIGVFLVGYISLWIWFGSILLLFLFGLTYKTFFPTQKWWIYAGLSLIIGVLPSIIFGEQAFIWIIPALLYPLFIYRGMMYATRSWEQLLPVAFMWYGALAIYFVSYLLFRYIEKLKPYLSIISIAGIITVIVILFISNHENLKASTLSKQRKPFVSRAIKNQNRVYLLLTVIVIFLVSNGKMIQEALFNGFRATIKFLLGLFSGGDGESIVEETPPPATMDLGALEPGEPSALAKFLETLVIYAFYVVLAVAVVILILSLIKKTRIWLKQIFQHIVAFLKQIVNRRAEYGESSHYVDEKESIFDWEEWKQEAQEKAKGLVQHIFKREPRWESLSNRDKVRYVYKQFLTKRLKHFNFKSAQTPRETLEQLATTTSIDQQQVEKLRDAYEQTRYGDKELDETRIQELHSLIREK